MLSTHKSGHEEMEYFRALKYFVRALKKNYDNTALIYYESALIHGLESTRLMIVHILGSFTATRGPSNQNKSLGVQQTKKKQETQFSGVIIEN